MAIKKTSKNRDAAANKEADEKPEAAKEADAKAEKKAAPKYPKRGGMYVISGKRVRPEDVEAFENASAPPTGGLTTKNSGGLVG